MPAKGDNRIGMGTNNATKPADEEIRLLHSALAEALDLFDQTWCSEHGHAPKPEQLARAAELRKFLKDRISALEVR